jgi:hypothetical protein
MDKVARTSACLVSLLIQGMPSQWSTHVLLDVHQTLIIKTLTTQGRIQQEEGVRDGISTYTDRIVIKGEVFTK